MNEIAALKSRWLVSGLVIALLTADRCAAVIDISDTTISGTLVVPADESADLSGVVTLDNGTIEVFGDLDSRGDDIQVVGNGQVVLRRPDGRWNYVSNTYDGVLIGSGVEVLGERGTRFYSQGIVNHGTIAAIGGSTSSSGFNINNTWGFENQGLLEARDGGLLWVVLNSSVSGFNPTGVIRANPGGVVRFDGPELGSLTDLGTLDNQGGVIELLRSTLNNAGQTTTFTGGNWELVDTRVNQGTLATAGGARLVIAPYRLGAFSYRAPVEFEGVTLSSDLTFVTGGELQVFNGLTLNNSTLRFESATGRMVLPADSVTGTPQLAGAGAIVAEGGTASLQASGGVVTLPASVALSATDGRIQFSAPSGSTGSAFEVFGDILADTDGSLIESFVPVTTRGLVTARNGGLIEVGDWTSHGPVTIEQGGLLELQGTLDNRGGVSIDGGGLVLRGGQITGPGSFSIANSTLFASTHFTLTDFLSIDGVGVDRAITAPGSVDLEGAAIAVGPDAGDRWQLTGGDLFNGVVNSLNGGELTLAETPVGQAWGDIYDLELNADTRVTAGATLNVAGPITGSGSIILDGGELRLGVRGEGAYVPDVIPRVTPLGGAVVFVGTVENSGTMTLLSGVEWKVTQSRNDTFVGGRIEGEPGAELYIEQGYNFRGTPWATMRQGVTLAVPTIVGRFGMSVREGLSLDDAHITIGTGEGDQFDDARLGFQGAQTLGGEGEIRFAAINGFPSNPEYPRINMIEVVPSPDDPAGLTIGPGITVRTSEGSGYIGGNYFYQLPPEQVPLANEGVLLAENGHTLSLFASELTQTGTLRAEAGSALHVTTPEFLNEGSVEAAGGVLEFSGDFAQAADAELDILLTDPVAAPAIQVGGFAALGGLLDVSLSEGLVPEVGDSFALLFAGGGFGGAFDALSLPELGLGKAWLLNPGGSTLFLEVREAMSADLDGDGDVDVSDILKWQREDGSVSGLGDWADQYPGEADFDRDGDADVADMLFWQRDPSVGDIGDWQPRTIAFSVDADVSTTPEPSGLMLAVVGASLAGRWRRSF